MACSTGSGGWRRRNGRATASGPAGRRGEGKGAPADPSSSAAPKATCPGGRAARYRECEHAGVAGGCRTPVRVALEDGDVKPVGGEPDGGGGADETASDDGDGGHRIAAAIPMRARRIRLRCMAISPPLRPPQDRRSGGPLRGKHPRSRPNAQLRACPGMAAVRRRWAASPPRRRWRGRVSRAPPDRSGIRRRRSIR